MRIPKVQKEPECFLVFISDIFDIVTDLIIYTHLYPCLWEYDMDRIREAVEPAYASDQNILHTPGF